MSLCCSLFLTKDASLHFMTVNQPFLLVVRVGLVNGTRWTESMPKDIVGKGKIVKWAPLQDVLITEPLDS
ncbi:unnamed protein product [Brassica oleracea var. botrytis]